MSLRNARCRLTDVRHRWPGLCEDSDHTNNQQCQIPKHKIEFSAVHRSRTLAPHAPGLVLCTRDQKATFASHYIVCKTALIQINTPTGIRRYSVPRYPYREYLTGWPPMLPAMLDRD